MDALPNGGISFMFLPADNFKEYNYWIYICPETASFSTSIAVKKLRAIASDGVKPWGTIQLDDTSILNKAIKSVLAEEDELPSSVAKYLFKIMIANFSAEHLFTLYKEQTSNSRNQYE
jgi:hypothetical protein